MGPKRSTAALAAAVISATLTASCSPSGTEQTHKPSPQDNLVMVDGDSHGYLTFDTDREVLTGYTRDGKKIWQENRYFPTDVHCTTSCPDAVISATADMNDSKSETHVIWKQADNSTTQVFTDKSLVVQWARKRDTWVATSNSGIIWSKKGKINTKTFTHGISDSMGRTSEDNSTLVISVQQNSVATWNTFRFPLTRGNLSPSSISTSLPGSVGCLSPTQGTMWTLGEKASEYSLITGKKIRSGASFASDCASSDISTILGAFSASSNGSTQDIAITSGGRSSPFKKIAVKSSGEIAVFQDCGLLLSNGKLTSLSPLGKKTETDISAHSMLTIPDGHIYSIGSSGKVEQHDITSNGQDCRIY